MAPTHTSSPSTMGLDDGTQLTVLGKRREPDKSKCSSGVCIISFKRFMESRLSLDDKVSEMTNQFQLLTLAPSTRVSTGTSVGGLNQPETATVLPITATRRFKFDTKAFADLHVSVYDDPGLASPLIMDRRAMKRPKTPCRQAAKRMLNSPRRLIFLPAPSKEPETTSAAPAARSVSPEAHFFGLPAELRNKIYRLALCREERVHLNAYHHEQPGITRVCKQARRESLLIYTKENTFEVQVVDFKPIVPNISTGFWLYKYERGLTMFRLTGATNWTNLEKWLEDYWNGGVSVQMTEGRSYPPYLEVCLKSFSMAKKHKHEGMTWSSFKVLFEFYKSGVQAGARGRGAVWR